MARVFGLGQPAAGDDGVGPAVIAALEQRALEGVALTVVAEPSALIEALELPEPVVLVDALVAAGCQPGEVLVLAEDEIARRAPRTVSSHGMGVADAIAMARTLHGAVCPITLVAVAIAAPDRHQIGLSEPVAAAVARAADRVVELVR